MSRSCLRPRSLTHGAVQQPKSGLSSNRPQPETSPTGQQLDFESEAVPDATGAVGAAQPHEQTAASDAPWTRYFGTPVPSHVPNMQTPSQAPTQAQQAQPTFTAQSPAPQQVYMQPQPSFGGPNQAPPQAACSPPAPGAAFQQPATPNGMKPFLCHIETKTAISPS